MITDTYSRYRSSQGDVEIEIRKGNQLAIKLRTAGTEMLVAAELDKVHVGHCIDNKKHIMICLDEDYFGTREYTDLY